MSSRVLTLTTAIVDRYLAIAAPTGIWVTQKCQIVTFVMIWLVCTSMAAPLIGYQVFTHADYGNNWHNATTCELKFPTKEARMTYHTVFFLLVFIIPVLLMLLLIVCTVIKTDKLRGNGRVSAETYRMTQRKVTTGKIITLKQVLKKV